jgi:hypothetical protein
VNDHLPNPRGPRVPRGCRFISVSNYDHTLGFGTRRKTGVGTAVPWLQLALNRNGLHVCSLDESPFGRVYEVCGGPFQPLDYAHGDVHPGREARGT